MANIIVLRSKDERVVNSVIFNQKNCDFTYCKRVSDAELVELRKHGYEIASYSIAVGAKLEIPKTNSYPAFTVSVIPMRGKQASEDKYEIVVDGMFATKFREREKDDTASREPDNFNYNYNVQPEPIIEPELER